MLNKTQEKGLAEMGGIIKLKVPELISQNKLTAYDLMFGVRLAPATAYRLASGKADTITFPVLSGLCDFFKVGVGDILEFIPESKENE